MKITELSSKQTTVYLFKTELMLHQMILDKIENEFDTMEHAKLIEWVEILQNLTESIQQRTKPIGVMEAFKNY